MFLEITDPDVNLFFSEIARTIYGRRPVRAPHLTIRGPYRGTVPRATLEAAQTAMAHEVLVIGGVGRFANPNEHVVYLSVSSPAMRRIWWKRDYSIEKYGFTPHISLYRGSDDALATALERFLHWERPQIYCAEFRIVSTVSKQVEMFPGEVPIARYPFDRLIRGNIRPNLLARLEVVVSRARRRGLAVEGTQAEPPA